MATLAGVSIVDKASPFDSGVALLIQQKCQVDEVLSVNSDWEVEVRSDSPYVVARGRGGGTDSADAFTTGFEAAQKGLDLLSLTGKADLSIRDAVNEILVWWREDGLQVLRIIATARMGVNVTVEAEVRDRFGNVKSSPLVPPPQYHECLRYFRLAQVTDALFDAYRNLWLSFELLLSSQYPKTGKEIDWLQRALTQAHNTLDLTKGYQVSGADVVQEIIDEPYKNARLPLFHATAKRTVFVPHNLQDREAVTAALGKLTHLLLFLIEQWLKAKRLSGGLTYYGFDTTIKDVLANSEILVSGTDQTLDKAEGTRAEAGLDQAVTLATRHAPELSEPGRQFWLGEGTSAELDGLDKIARCALTVGDTVFVHHRLETAVKAELTHGGIDKVEVQMGCFMVNVRQPKYLFSA